MLEAYPIYAVGELAVSAFTPDTAALATVSSAVESEESGSQVFITSTTSIPTVTPTPPPIIVPPIVSP